jgi:hypothetical protein
VIVSQPVTAITAPSTGSAGLQDSSSGLPFYAIALLVMASAGLVGAGVYVKTRS